MFEDGLSLDGVVELAEERDSFLRTRFADALSGVEEEVVAGIGCSGDVGIEDREVAYAGKDKVLEDGGGGG